MKMKLTCPLVFLALVSTALSTVLTVDEPSIIVTTNNNIASPILHNDKAIQNGTTEGTTTTVTETVPDDYLNWFFHHSFKKLDEFFQKEDDKEMRSNSEDDVTLRNNWKVRVSKVILKLVLIVLAIVGSALFILGVFLFMFVVFFICKFLGHILQCFREKRKYKNNSTTYQVSV